MRTGLFFAAMALAWLLGVGRAHGEELLAIGKRVYDQKCSQCHGEKGDGNGVAKDVFLPRPRDFTYGLFKIRTTPSGAVPSDDDLKHIIREGMPYTGMPAWRDLGEEELAAVVAYIKSFSGAFAGDAPQPIKIPGPPRSSPESVQRGRKLYEENKCFDCHGNAGRGDGKSSATLKNDWNEPIRPADLTKRWTFRGGSSREDIYRTFTTGLNGTPMPSYADLIGEEDRWHLVNYVYSLSRDEADYATVVTALAVDGDIDPAATSRFDGAPAAYFPVFGQVVEPEREFSPNVNGIEVRSIYNTTDLAFMLKWHDNTAGTSGANGPTLAAQDSAAAPGVTGPVYSDAVAIQVPSQAPVGAAKPYFLFGDARLPVDIWFADLARRDAQLLVGRGGGSVQSTGDSVAVHASYQDGEWTVVLKRGRQSGAGFDENGFVPVAFSVWDGFNRERGSRRGVTGWYHVYLKPARTESRTIPVVGYGLSTLLLEVVIIRLVRWRAKRRSSAAGTKA
jgi:DMSO reductase family type II enzyme heme b subunit